MDDQTANDECGICLETLNTAVTLPCNHKFCAACLDGWKSKFGAQYRKKEKTKLCPLCRKKIPPSKEMLSSLEFHRTRKLEFEARGDTTSKTYILQVHHVNKLEAEIGDYEGEGLDYDGCIEIPKEIAKAVMENNIKSVVDWLGSPVDKNRLYARGSGCLNATLVHLAVHTDNPDLLSILLQCGADVNALDANGYTPLIIATEAYVEKAKILLEWGAEISLPHFVLHAQEEAKLSNREAFVNAMIDDKNTKLMNLISIRVWGSKV